MDALCFPQFALLPKEIQIKIWECALELDALGPTTVSQMPARDGLQTTGWTRASALSAVNFLTRKLRGFSGTPALLKNSSGVVVRLDLEVDTVKVYDWYVPHTWNYRSQPLTRKIDPCPVRKLLCADYCTGKKFEHRGPSHFEEHLNLSRWPFLTDLTIAYTRADCEWFLDTFAVQGPDMNSVSSADCLWYLPEATDAFTAVEGALVYDKSQEGALYYQSRGIQVDAGVRWPVDQTEDPHGSMCDRRDITDERNRHFHTPKPKTFKRSTWKYRPNVGLRGFHKNKTSCGGMWAGFRYFPDVDPPRLEFSPLCWDEVKDASYACQNYDKVRGHLPEMVIKVFIVRQGQEAPSGGEHTCWEDVVHPPAYNLHILHTTMECDYMRIKAMWAFVTNKLSGGSLPKGLKVALVE